MTPEFKYLNELKKDKDYLILKEDTLRVFLQVITEYENRYLKLCSRPSQASNVKMKNLVRVVFFSIVCQLTLNAHIVATCKPTCYLFHVGMLSVLLLCVTLK